MRIEPKQYLNIPATGARIPLFSMEDDWATVGFQVQSEHPNGSQVMAGDGIIWMDAQGLAVAIAGNPDSGMMGLVRQGKAIR